MIHTQRLAIQKFTWDDFENYVALTAHSQVMQFSRKGPLKRAFEERILKNQLIGFSGLISQEIDGAPEIELAYRIDPQNIRSQKLSSRLGFNVEKQAQFHGFKVDIYARSSTH